MAYIGVAICIRICPVGNVQVMVPSKRWPISTVAVDPILVASTLEWHLGWLRTRRVHKAE